MQTITITSEIETSAVTVLSTPHGRKRRAERNIAVRDLKAAVKYGKKEVANPCPRTGEMRWKYTFADIVYITDTTSHIEITSWPVPGVGIDVEEHFISKDMKTEHENACKVLAEDMSSWTSHTVIVVDQSGSMRKTDVADGATRSDAVWVTLALDFIGKQLRSGQATHYDVVSVVGMNDKCSLLIDCQPTDWILFNTVLKLLRTEQPKLPGNYLPAIEAAERLLLYNMSGSCALFLLFLSDGRPSDFPMSKANFRNGETIICDRVARLASKFGRRLTVSTIGFAQRGEDFSVLKSMADITKEYGIEGTFQAPSLSYESLGLAISTITTSLTATKIELQASGDAGAARRTVRDVNREARSSADDFTVSDAWLVYQSHQVRRYKWSPDGGRRGGAWVEAPAITPGAVGVAMRRTVFGEGAERMVRKFREIGRDGVFVGPKMVAKESRFVEDLRSRDLIKFHEVFCKTQAQAQSLAEMFNDRVAGLPGVGPTMPRVEFLDCCVFEVKDVRQGDVGILVEKMLDPARSKKWNSNCGYVEGQKRAIDGAPAPQVAGPMIPLPAGAASALGTIGESDEDSEGESDELEDNQATAPQGTGLRVDAADVPQAFSHFTYRQTRRKMLVCDLQGALRPGTDSSPAVFELTDPVIHYRSSTGRTSVFGRTDRGAKGIHDFFRTHGCGELCRALHRVWFACGEGGSRVPVQVPRRADEQPGGRTEAAATPAGSFGAGA